MKEEYAIMHTPVLGYYWRTQGTHDWYDPRPIDFLLRGVMDQSTAETLVRIATEQGVEAMKEVAPAMLRLLQ